jgi:hypothetical protein
MNALINLSLMETKMYRTFYNGCELNWHILCLTNVLHIESYFPLAVVTLMFQSMGLLSLSTTDADMIE